MNYKKLFSLAILILGICPIGWAQKKPSTVMAKAITGEPVVSAAARPYAQLLADTKAFMNANNGYRPRVCINDERGIRLLIGNMTPAQQTEVRLARSISQILFDFRKGNLSANDPDLQELQTLVQENPRPRTPNQQTPYLKKHRQLHREEVINDVYNRTIEFIALHGARPRSTIYAEKTVPLSIQEVEREHPELLEEVRLGRQLNSLFTWGKTHAPDHPKIKELQDLLSLYRTKSVTRTPTLLLEELRIFLAKYHRLPRKQITAHGQRILAKNLAKKEYEEQLLGTRLNELLHTSKPIPELEQPSFNEIKQLVSLYRSVMPNEKELLEQINAWVAAHNGTRPRRNFFKNGAIIPVRLLSREQYQEVLLNRRLEYILAKTTHPTPEIEALQKIKELPLHAQPADKAETPQEKAYDNFEEEYFK